MRPAPERIDDPDPSRHLTQLSHRKKRCCGQNNPNCSLFDRFLPIRGKAVLFETNRTLHEHCVDPAAVLETDPLERADQAEAATAVELD